MEVAIEFVSGLAIGFGLLYVILGAYVFFGSSSPNLALVLR